MFIGISLMVFVSTNCGNNPFEMILNQSYRKEQDCGFVQNVYGQRISWKGVIPIILEIHESVPVPFRPVIYQAAQRWNEAAGRVLIEIADRIVEGVLQPRQDGANIIYWMTNWEAHRSGEQGRTLVYWIGNQIREVDIRINAKNFSYYIDDPQNDDQVHFESLVVHEIGHIWGLRHKDDSNSVMLPFLPVTTKRNIVPSVDIQSLRCEYQL